MAQPPALPAISAPAIYYLSIERFRGVKKLAWHPAKGVNVILGGGDVGKTTVLDAIGLLLSPTNTTSLSDSDYHARDIDAGFVIEAVLSLPPSSGINYQTKPAWPWQWTGTEAVTPSEDDPAVNTHPVYRLRVQGTEHELTYEIVQPDGSTDNLTVGLRRGIGLVRLGGDDRNDRDLRLVQGSALDRLLSDKALRSRLASGLAKNSVKNELTDPAKEAFDALDKAFSRNSLPSSLDLAVTGGQGFSVTALIGLTADRDGVQLPLASWGSGTRRMAALAIAEQKQGEAPITLVDELERGLEPYRQLSLVKKLIDGSAQVFVTTHSPSVISAAADASLWHIDSLGAIGSIDSAKLARHCRKEPETFLARLAIVAEGATEVGFATALLERALGSSLEDYGVHVTDAEGHDTALAVLEALAKGGLRFGGFADDEGKFPTRWQKVADKLGMLLFRWTSGCLEENIIAAVPDEQLETLFTDLGGGSGTRRRTIAERLDIEGDDKSFAALRAKAGQGFRAVIIEAALGRVPERKIADEKHFKSQARTWFKSRDGGRELADKMFGLGLWPVVRPQLLPFCNAVRTAIELPVIEDVPP